MKSTSKIEIKEGQHWRCKTRNFIIIVGKRLKDGWWKVHTPSKNKSHRMQVNSFHFYELIS